MQNADVEARPEGENVWDRVVPEANLPAMPLRQMVDSLRKLTRANIVIDQRALEAGGIDTLQTVGPIEFHDIKVSRLMQLIADGLSTPQCRVVADSGDDVIRLTIGDYAPDQFTVHIYDVRVSAARSGSSAAARRYLILKRLSFFSGLSSFFVSFVHFVGSPVFCQ